MDLAFSPEIETFRTKVRDWFKTGSPGRDMTTYFAGRAQSIYGGTNEIQRTIIARKVLGL